MATKQIAIRVDGDTADELKARAAIERRSVNAIVGDAIREYSALHPVSREQKLALIRGIMKEDAALLKALGEA
jgi:hypothetical protein